VTGTDVEPGSAPLALVASAVAASTGVTFPRGFRAAGVAAGLKPEGALDVAVVVNDGPSAAAAGVYTRNRVHAAPVAWSRRVTAAGRVRGVVLNSGGANACTGAQGHADVAETAAAAAAALGVGVDEVAVCSTGLIGDPLPMGRLLPGVHEAARSADVHGGARAAEAILTTDTVSKTAGAERQGVRVAGMAKGAGMLAPALATMLVVLTTDADADAVTLDDVLRGAVARTFDRLDSDGCMSTNDSVLLLASGASGVTPSADDLAALVEQVCADLVRQLVADAEGASKQITVEVAHAASERDAVEVARAVARSNLFKCAVHGEDPNWGRVLAAVGTADAVFDPDQLDVAMNGVWVARAGAAGESRDDVDLSGEQVHVVVDLHAGSSTATVLTNDLTADYVHENSAYSS
jgi:glutamate N-acetyltransferase / amino-acid N-acetyltransferase